MQAASVLEMAEQALDYGVMGLLGLMSVVTLWLFIERMMFYKSEGLRTMSIEIILILTLQII